METDVDDDRGWGRSRRSGAPRSPARPCRALRRAAPPARRYGFRFGLLGGNRSTSPPLHSGAEPAPVRRASVRGIRYLFANRKPSPESSRFRAICSIHRPSRPRNIPAISTRLLAKIYHEQDLVAGRPQAGRPATRWRREIADALASDHLTKVSE
jgi:hypothetical protein